MLVYAAGKGNQCFVASFTVASKPEQWASPRAGLEDLMKYFPIGCDIKEAALWKAPVPMVDVVNELGFIGDKKNHGLYLRQGAKLLTRKDVDVILSARDRQTKRKEITNP